jgi:hypothetical protein
MFRKPRKNIFVAAALLTLFWMGVFFVVSGAIAMEEGVEEYRPSAFMVIEAKSLHSIVASKRQFELTRETQIFDGNGKEIRIKDLPVPCKAQVDYETSNHGDPVALKIVIKQVFPGASTDWSDVMPD